MSFPRVWELLGQFKTRCGGKGWKIFPDEDVVNTGNEYHYFAWTPHIRPKTLQKVIKNPQTPIRDGLSYRMVSLSYIAWVSPETINEDVLEVFSEVSDRSRKTALYDVSPLYEGKTVCLRVNETSSNVFHEFEMFLTEKYGVSFKPLHKPQATVSSV